jgi:hypothetical protein
MAFSVLCGTKLTPDSYFLDDVFLLCFLPRFGGEDKHKAPERRRGKKTHVFLPTPVE